MLDMYTIAAMSKSTGLPNCWSEGSADAAFIGWALVLDTSWGNNAAAALGAAPRFLEHYEYAV